MTLLYIAAGLILLAYLGLPLMIRQTLKIASRPDAQPATESFLPPDVQDYFAEVSPKLAQLGFERATCFTMDGSTPNVKPYVSMWVHRPSGRMAAANVLIASQGEKPPKITRYTEFVTILVDGASVTTTNSSEIGAFKKVAKHDTLGAARLTEPAHLLRLHAWRETKLLGSGRRYLPEPGKELHAFVDLYEKSIRRQAEVGYLQPLAGDDSTFQPTLVGAYMMTWAQLPPMKGFKHAAEEKRAEAQIRQAAGAQPKSSPLRHAA